MTAKRYAVWLICITLITASNEISAQKKTTVVDSSSKGSVIVIPGKQYDRGMLHRFFWGPQWRKEWTTPVRVPILNMDSAYGGLKPTKAGGGKQTKNLRLEAGNGREYAIRSVDKNYGKSIPEEFQGTFLQKIVDDQMSSAYPYAGLVIKKLSAAAGIYSTNPALYFVKEQPRLDSFNKEYANYLYALEDRPGNQNAKHYGAEEIEGAEELFEAMQKKPYEKIDQIAYAKARLFDLLVGDWDRHFDQWEWAKKDVKGEVVYFAMPKDRDQGFSSYDGRLLRSATKGARLSMLQPFRGNIRDVEGFTWVYRNFDAPLLNEVSRETWLAKAKELQSEITDNVIEEALKQLPPEVYTFSAANLASVLKERRDHLEDFAAKFYKSLTEEIVILGSEHNDRIEVINQDEHHVQVNMYAPNNSKPYYSRSFNDEDTREVRIFSMKGDDHFTVSGDKKDEIVVRLIGGPDKDKYEVPSSFSRKAVIYDDKENDFSASSAKFRSTNDTLLYKYNGKPAKNDEFRLRPVLGFTNDDGVYAGLGLRAINYRFLEEPFVSRNDLQARYSFTQKAWSYHYKGLFRNIIRHVDLGLVGEYDMLKEQSFFGVGNNTSKISSERQYYRYTNKEANAGLNVIANIAKHHTFTVGGFYQMVQIYNDPGRYMSQVYLPSHTNVLDKQNFIGARAAYDFTHVNHAVVPTAGGTLRLGFDHTVNTDNKKIVNRVSGLAGFIFPIGPFTLASRLGAAKLWGEPEFYQLNKIGGGTTLRGYARPRLYGYSSLYNQNELQWLFNVKSYLFNGKAGLVALYDNGRVWMPNETSDKWYHAFGGGFMIAPFEKLSVTVAYAVSDEDKRLSIRIGHFLNR